MKTTPIALLASITVAAQITNEPAVGVLEPWDDTKLPAVYREHNKKRHPQIVLLRTYIITNFIPGYIGGPEPTVGTNGFINNFTLSIAITQQPQTNLVTNYVLGYIDGTNVVELFTAERK